MTALYSEWEAYPAAWLRNLIAAGHIADGVVDERSIVDLRAADVVGRGQRHLFAGLGGWSYAFRLAGIPDDADAWSLSCPCQGLSVAGLQRGADDDRHLWPVAFEFIAECLPPILFGEQVAGAAGVAWLTAVRADLERIGYAVGAADLAAAGVGAPHIRQRIFFGAVRLSDADGERRDGIGLRLLGRGPHEDRAQARWRGEVDGLADRDGAGLAGRPVDGSGGEPGESAAERGGGGGPRWLPDAEGSGWSEGRVPDRGADNRARPADGGGMGDADREPSGRDGGAVPRAEGEDAGVRRGDHGPRAASGDVGSPPVGPWDDLEWLACTDGKARPTQPGLHPLAHGHSGRVAVVRTREQAGAEVEEVHWYSRTGVLKAGGNAIVPEVAAQFIGAFLDAVADARRAA